MRPAQAQGAEQVHLWQRSRKVHCTGEHRGQGGGDSLRQPPGCGAHGPGRCGHSRMRPGQGQLPSQPEVPPSGLTWGRKQPPELSRKKVGCTRRHVIGVVWFFWGVFLSPREHLAPLQTALSPFHLHSQEGIPRPQGPPPLSSSPRKEAGRLHKQNVSGTGCWRKKWSCLHGDCRFDYIPRKKSPD